MNHDIAYDKCLTKLPHQLGERMKVMGRRRRWVGNHVSRIKVSPIVSKETHWRLICLANIRRICRTISGRGHPEAKAGKNIGQGKPPEDVTEKAEQTDQQKRIFEVSLTRSPSRFVGVLRLPRLRTTRFHGGGLPDDRTWHEGVFSLKHRRSNETNQYHPAQQSPHENDWLPWNENIHGRPPGTKSGSLSAIILRKPRHFFVKIQSNIWNRAAI
jgi:hypothetical protein